MILNQKNSTNEVLVNRLADYLFENPRTTCKKAYEVMAGLPEWGGIRAKTFGRYYSCAMEAVRERLEAIEMDRRDALIEESRKSFPATESVALREDVIQGLVDDFKELKLMKALIIDEFGNVTPGTASNADVIAAKRARVATAQQLSDMLGWRIEEEFIPEHKVIIEYVNAPTDEVDDTSEVSSGSVPEDPQD